MKRQQKILTCTGFTVSALLMIISISLAIANVISFCGFLLLWMLGIFLCTATCFALVIMSKKH